MPSQYFIIYVGFARIVFRKNTRSGPDIRKDVPHAVEAFNTVQLPKLFSNSSLSQYIMAVRRLPDP
jgi:hypothetical protein